MSNAALQTETQAPTTELVLLSSVPAKIQFNLQEFRQNIRNELKKYDLVVTVDTVKDAKALAADLNGQAKSLKDRFKDAAALVTKPVDDLGLEVADIVTEILESREKLTAQIKKFEDERKVVVRNAIEAKRLELWDSLEVAEEFRDASIDKLVKLTALTAKDSLTSTTLRDLQSLIDNNRRLQDQTEKRLLMLENQSYKEGLKAPLTREHVESFLFDAEASYAGKLAHMMTSELKRQAATEEATRRQVAEEQQRAQQEAVPEPVQQSEPVPQRFAPPTKEEQLQVQIKRAKEALPYAEGNHSEELRNINHLEQQLRAMQQPAPVQQQAEQLDVIFTPNGSPSEMLDRIHASKEEAYQAALSASANQGTLVDVWTKNQGRVAIADGATGRVYVWNQF
jgi:hypothetical protein